MTVNGRTAVKSLSRIILGCVLLAGALAAGAAETQPTVESSVVWDKVRASLFAARPINTNADSVIKLETPNRAEDAAIVPISVKTLGPQTAQRFIQKIYLVIDGNPSPIAAVFTFTPDSGRADIETRVRVEQYTPIRAIAEMNDGELFMAARFMKASGGCSAPAGKDLAAALATVGKMRLRLDQDVKLGEPNLVQLMISHPNTSGLAMDQVSRLYTPAYFVRRVDVSYSGNPVFSADVDFSISENPNFRFYFAPHGEGELLAQVVDTKDLSFSTRLAIKPRTAQGSPTEAR